MYFHYIKCLTILVLQKELSLIFIDKNKKTPLRKSGSGSPLILVNKSLFCDILLRKGANIYLFPANSCSNPDVRNTSGAFQLIAVSLVE